MADVVSSSTAGFTRCAVCKINLKGRFVYIDDVFEQLLGETREDLFGKSLLDYVDDNSKSLIAHLLSERNHYESFFDTATIGILGSGGDTIPIRIVASLNYIAGNPVNIQFILDTSSTVELKSASDTIDSTDYEEFLDDLLTLDNPNDLKAYLQLLQKFTGAEQALLYLIKGKELEPRSGVCYTDSPEFAFNSISEPTSLHHHIAQTGVNYSLADTDAVRDAIERDGEAPPEFVSRIKRGETKQYLLRLIFSEEMTPGQTARACMKAHRAIELESRVYLSLASNTDSGSNESIAEDPSVDVKFTVGFLDNIGIGALLIGVDGKIVGYNPTLASIFNGESVGDEYHAILRFLSQSNPASTVDSIKNHLITTGTMPEKDLHIVVSLPSGEQGNITIIRLAGHVEDMSAIMIVQQSTLSPNESKTTGLSDAPWRQIIDGIATAHESVEAATEKFTHRFYQRLGKNGNKQLLKLSEMSNRLKDMLDDVLTMIKLVTEPEEEIIADIGMLVDESINEVRHHFPNKRVKCKHESLPKIEAYRVKLRTILHSLLSNAVRFTKEQKVDVEVTCQQTSDQIDISVTDHGRGIPSEYLPNIFQIFYRFPDDSKPVPPGNGISLGIVRQLVQYMGGQIRVESVIGQGTKITLTLPLKVDEYGGESDA